MQLFGHTVITRSTLSCPFGLSCVIIIKCAEKNNFKANHLKNLAISGLFLGLVTDILDVLFAAVHLKDGGKLAFADGLEDPLQACLEAALGQRAVC